VCAPSTQSFALGATEATTVSDKPQSVAESPESKEKSPENAVQSYEACILETRKSEEADKPVGSSVTAAGAGVSKETAPEEASETQPTTSQISG